MATLAEMRARLRARLEDEGATPLWSDAALNEALRVALEEYAQWRPRETRQEAQVFEGDETIGGLTEAVAVVRVEDPAGRVVPPRAAAPARATADEEQAWELFDGTIVFTRTPLAPGIWRLWYLATRPFPVADAVTFPVEAGDAGLVLAIAALWALEQRATGGWKRGQRADLDEARLAAARREVERQWTQRRRLRSRPLGAAS